METVFYIVLFILFYLVCGVITGLLCARSDSKLYNVDMWEYLSSPAFTDMSIRDFLVTLAFWPVFLVGFIFFIVLCGGLYCLLEAIEWFFTTIAKKIFTYIHDKKEVKKNANLG